MAYFTGEINYNGRGRYDATYSLNDYLLGYDYLINPQYTEQFAQAEGLSLTPSGWCPEFSYNLFGGTGSSYTYNSSTVLRIQNNHNPPDWVTWTPGNIATASHLDNPPYHRDSLNDYDAFEAYGGGP